MAINSSFALNISDSDLKKIDLGNKTIKDNKKVVKISWNTTDEGYSINVKKAYKVSNKKDNSKIKGYATVFIEKPKKSQIKITTTYSTGPSIDRIKHIETNLSINDYYWKVYEPKYLKKVYKPMLSKSKIIDKGKTHNNHTELKWKTYTYNNYKQVIIKHNYHIGAIRENKPGYFYIDYFTYGQIELKKINKNTLKINATGLVNSKSNFNNKVIYLKTKLSAKSYYLKYYKTKMIKYFLN